MEFVPEPSWARIAVCSFDAWQEIGGVEEVERPSFAAAAVADSSHEAKKAHC